MGGDESSGGDALNGDGEVIKLPRPTGKEFDDDVTEEERQFCMERFADLNLAKLVKMDCTACGKHLGLTAHHALRLRMHPLLRTVICTDCLEFYNSGEFDKGEDGSELYCRWCGQGGQVYCCSSCPVVFCMKCVKRNFGPDKINEIESIDDWSCFVCNPKVLWCHRAALWAARRYCFWKNKMSLTVTDSAKRVRLQKECQTDESTCCMAKRKIPIAKPKTTTTPEAPKVVAAQLPKAVKRLSGPVTVKKVLPQIVNATIRPVVANADHPPLKKIAIAPMQTYLAGPRLKRVQLRHSLPIANGPTSIRPIQPPPMTYYNYQNIASFNDMTKFSKAPNSNHSQSFNDNINLSLESLTQGLDVSSLGNNATEDDGNVVCTPDFPLPIEPLCQVEEVSASARKVDDDVQILTPPPKIMPRPLSALTNPKPRALDINPFNVVKMSENDVTINKVTGGLKFRIDPAKLSTSKMYQLPDGRVFAVNINPNMPGGYSATIVTVNDSSKSSLNNSGSMSKSPIVLKSLTRPNSHSWTTPVVPDSPKTSAPRILYTYSNAKKSTPESSNDPSLEWYPFNLYEAVDLMTYVTKKLIKFKHDIPTDMKSKSTKEIKDMHYSLEQLLKISCERFTKLRNTLNDDFAAWLKTKNSPELLSDDDGLKSDEVTADFNRLMSSQDITNDEPILIDESDVRKDNTLSKTATDDNPSEKMDVSEENVPSDLNDVRDGESNPEEHKSDDDTSKQLAVLQQYCNKKYNLGMNDLSSDFGTEQSDTQGEISEHTESGQIKSSSVGVAQSDQDPLDITSTENPSDAKGDVDPLDVSEQPELRETENTDDSSETTNKTIDTQKIDGIIDNDTDEHVDNENSIENENDDLSKDTEDDVDSNSSKVVESNANQDDSSMSISENCELEKVVEQRKTSARNSPENDDTSSLKTLDNKNENSSECFPKSDLTNDVNSGVDDNLAENNAMEDNSAENNESLSDLLSTLPIPEIEST